jgi:outer membrane protein TolC
MTFHLDTAVRSRRVASALLLATLLAGCASLDPDAGFGSVQQAVRQHMGQELRWERSDDDRRATDSRLAHLLAGPLSADDTVQIALLNHRGLQAAFDELGIAEADRVRALSAPNPGIGFGRSQRGAERESELSLHFNLARLLVLPLVAEVESQRIAQLQADTAMRVLSLAAEVRRAWINAVAATESVRYAGQVMEAASVSAELARRMAATGNFNKLQHAREQSFQADATLNLARAEQWQRISRERLTRLLGLWGEQIAFRLPDRLPDPPATLETRTNLEALAIGQRLDVQGARLAAERTAKSLGLTRATRFVNVLEIGSSRERSNEAPDKTSWEVSLELPVFDTGSARLARAEAVYRQALNRAAETAINARSEVREAWSTSRSAWEIARYHREQIVPLRQRIAEENLLRYNGMLIGVFELLADARAQISSVNAAIEALRDFWLAQADLDMALIGRPMGPTAGAPALARPADAPAHARPH